MQIWKFRDVVLPVPTLDCIIPQAGNIRPLIRMFRDVNGNFHQVRTSKIIPVLIERNGELVQLEQEILVNEKKRQGWYSAVKNLFIRNAKLADGTKKLVAMNEVVFEPDNRSTRVFMAQALRRNHEKHQVTPWWQTSTFIAGIYVVGGLFALLVTGYFVSDMWQANIEQMAPLASAADKLATAMTILSPTGG